MTMTELKTKVDKSVLLAKYSPEEIEAYERISKDLENALHSSLEQEADVMSNLMDFYESQGDVDFLAKISHEMRTPLNAIVGMIDLLKLEIENTDSREKLKILDYSTRQLSSIIHTFIDVTSIQLGQVIVQNGIFNFEQILKNAVDTYTPDAKMRGGRIAFQSNLEPGLTLEFDKNRLIQILNNALHSCVNECVNSQVYVTANQVAEENNKVSIEVRIGCLPECRLTGGKVTSSMDRMPAFDVSFSLKVAENLANFFGGEIEFYQADSGDREVVISFTLPRAEKAISPIEPESASEAPTFKGKRILLVEDVEVNILIARRFLEKLGLDITVAVDGEMAVETLLENNFDFDLVLLDIYMPKRDGFFVIDQLRQQHKVTREQLPVIAVTASTEPRVIQNIENGNFQDVLYKPYIIEDLVRVLDQQMA